MLLEKIRKKDNIPIILFSIILINYIPLIIPNLFSKESHGVSMVLMGICFAIEIILLIMSLWKNIEFTHENKKEINVLIGISAILIIVQIVKLISGNCNILDFFNIGCLFINILLLYICFTNLKVNEELIFSFMKGIMIFGLISCLANFVIYYKEIFQTILGINHKMYIKSFFANRNQFAFFLYISIIANVLLLIKENKKTYKIILGFLIFNLFFSMSRTGIAVVVMFFALVFLFSNKISKKTKIICLTLTIIFGIIMLVILYYLNPGLFEMLFRFSNVKNLSGRTAIWENGVKLLMENPINIIFGVGRFQGNEVLHIKDKSFTQFHNIYLDFLIAGGVLELIFIIYIFKNVIKKFNKSNIEEKYKKIYKIAFFTYFIYACFESVGRFSIGAVDALCLIFFVSIPLVYSNSIKEK